MIDILRSTGDLLCRQRISNPYFIAYILKLHHNENPVWFTDPSISHIHERRIRTRSKRQYKYQEIKSIEKRRHVWYHNITKHGLIIYKSMETSKTVPGMLIAALK